MVIRYSIKLVLRAQKSCSRAPEWHDRSFRSALGVGRILDVIFAILADLYAAVHVPGPLLEQRLDHWSQAAERRAEQRLNPLDSGGDSVGLRSDRGIRLVNTGPSVAHRTTSELWGPAAVTPLAASGNAGLKKTSKEDQSDQ